MAKGKVPPSGVRRDALKKGFVQVYTGDGKGKTTAAIGLAVRAAGAGLCVLFAQFIKGIYYHELTALERFADLITVKRYGTGRFIRKAPTPADIVAARGGLDELADLLPSGRFDVVILDEANVAVSCGLFDVDDLLRLIKLRPDRVEVVVTGRDAHARLIERADLVTEMTVVKHYWDRGIKARDGIEK
jgi:cob(I)alamin adenosyltransferase